MTNLLTNIFSGQVHQISLLVIGLIFIGGVVSSLSPCTLGILPVIMGYVGGYSENTTKRTVIQVLCFVLGLSIVLTTLGMIAAFTGQALGFHTSPVLGLVLASLILIMGLSLLEVIELPMPVIIKQMPKNKDNNMILYPLVLGGTFALASTPCSTPILAGIMAYASFKANLLFGGILLFVYALGQSVILVFAGLFTSLFKKVSVLKTFSAHFNKFSGTILILAALFLYLKIFGVA
jgi:cytochrome c-type biogenesis protein